LLIIGLLKTLQTEHGFRFILVILYKRMLCSAGTEVCSCPGGMYKCHGYRVVVVVFVKKKQCDGSNPHPTIRAPVLMKIYITCSLCYDFIILVRLLSQEEASKLIIIIVTA
jgi:hypothetical protein